MHLKNRSLFYTLFTLTLFTTEFYFLEIFGGTVRIYHLLAPVVILFLNRSWPSVLKNSIFWCLISFIFINLIAALASESPSDALLSVALLTLNISIAVAVALILIDRRLDFYGVMRLSLLMTAMAVMLGIIQLVAFKFGGVDLALSESQTTQLIGGFSSGFRYEANTFARQINVVFCLWLPTILAKKNTQLFKVMFILLLLGMLTAFTRSAILGLTETIIFYAFWKLRINSSKTILKRLFILGVISLFLFILFASYVETFNPYAAYKIENIFNFKETLQGGSVELRLLANTVLWNAFSDSFKTILIGNGWGQVYFYYQDMIFQAGGSDVALVLAYSGIVGIFSYFLYQLVSIYMVARTVKDKNFSNIKELNEGVFLALVCVFLTGLHSGSLISPEYWILFGFAIYIVHLRRRKKQFGKSMPFKLAL